MAFPGSLDAGPSDWRNIHPALLASYCVDQDIKLYTYKHTNLEVAENPFTPGGYVIKSDYDDPDLAVVVTVSDESDGDRDVSIVFLHHLKAELGDNAYMAPADFESFCDEGDIKSYSYRYSDLSFENQYQ